MPRGASPKREREYKELKSRFKKEHRYKGREEEVASRIVNKQRNTAKPTKPKNRSAMVNHRIATCPFPITVTSPRRRSKARWPNSIKSKRTASPPTSANTKIARRCSKPFRANLNAHVNFRLRRASFIDSLPARGKMEA